MVFLFYCESLTMTDYSRVFLTVDCSDCEAEILCPRSQIDFMEGLVRFIPGSIFANSLVYSTPCGNTGWTSLCAGTDGQFTYHHWDAAKPSLLQLDLACVGSLDLCQVIEVISQRWCATGMRVLKFDAIAAVAGQLPTVFCDNLLRRSGPGDGLGPGRHLHLLVDYRTAGCREPLSRATLDAALVELVGLLGMVGMTPALSAIEPTRDGSRYDGVIGITTSHILLRVYQSTGVDLIRLEVFSCKEFSPDIVRSWLACHFGQASEAYPVLIDRHPNHTVSAIDWVI